MNNRQPMCSHPVDGSMTTADGLRLCCNPEHTKDATYKTLGPFWHHVSDWPKDSGGFCQSNPTELQRIAREASECQDACNLSGVAHAMDRAVSVLWKVNTQGTEWVNRHPVMTLFLSKLCSLNGGYYECDYFHASDACEALARGESVDYQHAGITK